MSPVSSDNLSTAEQFLNGSKPQGFDPGVYEPPYVPGPPSPYMIKQLTTALAAVGGDVTKINPQLKDWLDNSGVDPATLGATTTPAADYVPGPPSQYMIDQVTAALKAVGGDVSKINPALKQWLDNSGLDPATLGVVTPSVTTPAPTPTPTPTPFSSYGLSNQDAFALTKEGKSGEYSPGNFGANRFIGKTTFQTPDGRRWTYRQSVGGGPQISEIKSPPPAPPPLTVPPDDTISIPPVEEPVVEPPPPSPPPVLPPPVPPPPPPPAEMVDPRSTEWTLLHPNASAQERLLAWRDWVAKYGTGPSSAQTFGAQTSGAAPLGDTIDTDYEAGKQYPNDTKTGGQPDGSIPMGYHWIQNQNGMWILQQDTGQESTAGLDVGTVPEAPTTPISGPPTTPITIDTGNIPTSYPSAPLVNSFLSGGDGVPPVTQYNVSSRAPSLKGLTTENMVPFAKTPAGRSLMQRLGGVLNV